MRIALYSDAFIPSINGMVSALVTLITQLSVHGHTVGFFYPQAETGKEHTLSLPRVSWYPSISFPSMIYPDFRIGVPTPQSIERLRSFKPDVVHVQSPGSIGVGGLLAAKLLKVPVVGTFHGYFMEKEYLELVSMAWVPLLSDLLWSYAIAIYNQCDAVIPLNNSTARDLTQHGLTVPLHFISNPLAIDEVQLVKKTAVAAFRKKYHLQDQVLLYVGRISKEKSLPELVDAFVLVQKRLPQSQLMIIGDGPQLSALQKHAEKRHVEKSCIFTGGIPHEELLQLGAYQSARVFGTMSTSEVQPISILEAMAAGLPIVGVAQRGMIDIVADNGYLVKSGNSNAFAEKVTTVLTTPRIQKQMRVASLREVKKYHASTVVEKLETLYQSLIHKKLS